MNYTEKYHLPQWEETDRIMRTDFNQMCADLESGLTAAQAKADGAYSPDNMPYAIGTYVGNGDVITVELGFMPSLVIITGQIAAYNESDTKGILVAGRKQMRSMVNFLENGFSVEQVPTSTTQYRNAEHPKMNTSNKDYTYIAFR